MPAPITVTQPAELLPLMFATWTEVKKKQVRTWLKNQAVTVNGRAISQFNHALKMGDVVEVRIDRTAAPDSMLLAPKGGGGGKAKGAGSGGIKIRHEDDTLIVIEKPSGLLSIATEEEREKTVYFLLNEYLREKSNRFDRERVWIVHRLDRETSGLMVFAKTEEAKRALQDDWEHVEKQYFAVVEGAPMPSAFKEDYLAPKIEGPHPIRHTMSPVPADAGVAKPGPMGSPLPTYDALGSFESYLDESHPYRVRSGKPGEKTRYALTHYKVLQRKGPRALMELTLRTGRRHQIRVHLSEAGISILGDPKYGEAGEKARRLALHACTLRFKHPESEEVMEFISPLPPELKRLLGAAGTNQPAVLTNPRLRKRDEDDGDDEERGGDADSEKPSKSAKPNQAKGTPKPANAVGRDKKAAQIQGKSKTGKRQSDSGGKGGSPDNKGGSPKPSASSQKVRPKE